MTILNIGGGFNGSEFQLEQVLQACNFNFFLILNIVQCRHFIIKQVFLPLIFQIHSTVAPLLEAYFPSGSGVSVIAEPGNFFVFSTFTLAVNVIGKKSVYQDLHGEINSKYHHIR